MSLPQRIPPDRRQIVLAEKIVDALIRTLDSLNYPVLIVSNEDVRFGAPGEVIRQ